MHAAQGMDLELDSRIEERIDEKLLKDESDNLSLPGVARRAPHGYSSDDTGLLTISDTSGQTTRTVRRSNNPLEFRVQNMSSEGDAILEPNNSLARNAHNLDQRLLEESDSLRLSLKESQISDTSSQMYLVQGQAHTKDESADDMLMDQGSAAHSLSTAPMGETSVRTCNGHLRQDSYASSDSLLDSPSTSRARGTSSAGGTSVQEEQELREDEEEKSFEDVPEEPLRDISQSSMDVSGRSLDAKQPVELHNEQVGLKEPAKESAWQRSQSTHSDSPKGSNNPAEHVDADASKEAARTDEGPRDSKAAQHYAEKENSYWQRSHSRLDTLPEASFDGAEPSMSLNEFQEPSLDTQGHKMNDVASPIPGRVLEATTPLQPPAPGRTSFAAAPMALQQSGGEKTLEQASSSGSRRPSFAGTTSRSSGLGSANLSTLSLGRALLRAEQERDSLQHGSLSQHDSQSDEVSGHGSSRPWPRHPITNPSSKFRGHRSNEHLDSEVGLAQDDRGLEESLSKTSVDLLRSLSLDTRNPHIDPHRLVLYQNRVNERLAHENDLLKANCDELMHLVEQYRKQLEESRSFDIASERQGHADEVAQLRGRVAELEASAEQRPEPVLSAERELLEDTTDALQDHHEKLLQDVSNALAREGSSPLSACVLELRAALNQAHGVINALRAQSEPDKASASQGQGKERQEQATGEAPRVSKVSEPANESSRANISASQTFASRTWRHSTPSRTQPIDALRRSVTLVDPDATRITTDLDAVHDAVRTLTAELQSTRHQLDEALAHSAAASAAKLRIEDRLAAAEADWVEAQERLGSKTQHLAELREDYAERSQSLQRGAERQRLESELAHAHEDVYEARAQLQLAEQQRALLEEHLRTEAARYEHACKEADEARAAHRAYEQRMDEQVAEIHALRTILEDQDTELGQLRGEKDHLWVERHQIMEQLGRFEQHLREVRAETEQYGAELRALQFEKKHMLAAREAEREREKERLERHVARALDELRPRLYVLEDEVRTGAAVRRDLVAQKAYLSKALHAQEWLYERTCARLEQLAPLLRRFGGYSPRPRASRLRAAVWAVRFAIRLSCV